MASLKIKKGDSVIVLKDLKVKGATATLKAGTKVDTIITGADGTAETRELLLGSYKVIETGSAEYYAMDETEQEVQLSFDRQVETVHYDLTVKNEKTKVRVSKVDVGDHSKELTGAELYISDEEGNIIDSCCFFIIRIAICFGCV